MFVFPEPRAWVFVMWVGGFGFETGSTIFSAAKAHPQFQSLLFDVGFKHKKNYISYYELTGCLLLHLIG